MQTITEYKEQIDFDAAVDEFRKYLRNYRQYSPWTIRSYGIDLQQFNEFLLASAGEVPSPAEITRQQVLAWDCHRWSHVVGVCVLQRLRREFAS
jgi:site-specific recombinase XerD